MTILVTGCAGFIGMHVAKRLLECGARVIGLDNLNPYYDVRLKEARLRELAGFENMSFTKLDLADKLAMEQLFRDARPVRVVHLAAQAGVRYSLQDPHAYVSSNLVGFVNVLEACRHGAVEHLVYASTSSVYGANVSTPFREDDPVDISACTQQQSAERADGSHHSHSLDC
jgi:UDP-glucuronate 4-epimerase